MLYQHVVCFHHRNRLTQSSNSIQSTEGQRKTAESQTKMIQFDIILLLFTASGYVIIQDHAGPDRVAPVPFTELGGLGIFFSFVPGAAASAVRRRCAEARCRTAPVAFIRHAAMSLRFPQLWSQAESLSIRC